MTCPICRTGLTLRYKYRVKGLRYNNLPGLIRVYWCKQCQQKVRCCEVLETRLAEWNDIWERQRQDWIREKARLEEKLSWLRQPTDYAEQKLLMLRGKLIHLIESTF